jgi:putative hydrolase of the HAD superfamily
MDLDDETDLRPFWDRYLETYARALGVAEETIPEAVENLRNQYVSGGLWAEVIDGAKEGLESLVSTGVPVGIVSNSDGTIEQRLRAMGVLQVGPGEGVEVLCLVDSGSVGVEKPNPRIFDHAFDSLGVAREGAWYVGDTPAFDVVGALRAGLRPLLMDPFDLNADFGAECVRSLRQVAEMIDSLSS